MRAPARCPHPLLAAARRAELISVFPGPCPACCRMEVGRPPEGGRLTAPRFTTGPRSCPALCQREGPALEQTAPVRAPRLRERREEKGEGAAAESGHAEGRILRGRRDVATTPPFSPLPAHPSLTLASRRMASTWKEKTTSSPPAGKARNRAANGMCSCDSQAGRCGCSGRATPSCRSGQSRMNRVRAHIASCVECAADDTDGGRCGLLLVSRASRGVKRSHSTARCLGCHACATW